MQLAAVLQTPLEVSHCRLQQSVATAHELPAPLQLETDEEQVLATGSQVPEQHWELDVHAAPTTVQVTPTPPVFPDPPCPVLVLPEPPVPEVITFAELLPQLGRASNAASKSAKMAAIDRVVGEGFMMT